MTKNRKEPKKKKSIKKKKIKKNKILKKAKSRRKSVSNKLPIDNKVIEVVEKSADETAQIIIPNPSEKLIVPNGIRKNQDTITTSKRFFYDAPGTNYFIILSIISIVIFMIVGYVYPATEEDIIYNRVIWTNDGKYDRGLFNQFYTSIAFTSGVFLLGFYISITFIKLNVRNWNFFAIGILTMFIFGLGKIGELIFNHYIFDVFKNVVLPIALIILTYASHRIYKDLTGVIYNGS